MISYSYNRINDNGLFTLVNGVSSNECLLSIKLAKNTFTSDGCLSIIGSILQNETSLIQFVDFGVCSNILTTIIILDRYIIIMVKNQTKIYIWFSM